MHQRDYDPFKKELSEELVKSFGERLAAKQTTEIERQVHEVTEKTVDGFRDANKLFTLADDEVRCLMAYRDWKASSKYVNGVFHWRKE